MADSFEFEIIPESEVDKTARGRKSTVDPRLVEGLKGLKKGQAVRINSMKLDPKSKDYGKAKAAKSAQIRVAMRTAGHDAFSCHWSTDGIPQVVVN
jgi:hypothetical protein